MSETTVTQPQMSEKPPLPNLPCPNCSENLLAKGFYNSCTETVRLREDNFALWSKTGERLYVDHDEDGHETTDHECDLAAFCVSCDHSLPWPLYRIRDLDYKQQPDIDRIIAALIGAAQKPTD